MPLPGVDSACSQTYFGTHILRSSAWMPVLAFGDPTMKNTRPPSSELSSEIRDLPYRIEQSSPSRRIAEPPADTEKTLRRWCTSDEEFSTARSLAGELGIQLLN